MYICTSFLLFTLFTRTHARLPACLPAAFHTQNTLFVSSVPRYSMSQHTSSHRTYDVHFVLLVCRAKSPKLSKHKINSDGQQDKKILSELVSKDCGVWWIKGVTVIAPTIGHSLDERNGRGFTDTCWTKPSKKVQDGVYDFEGF